MANSSPLHISREAMDKANPKHYTPKNPSPTPSTYETLKDSKNQNVTPANQMYIRKNRPTYPVNTAPPKKPLHL